MDVADRIAAVEDYLAWRESNGCTAPLRDGLQLYEAEINAQWITEQAAAASRDPDLALNFARRIAGLSEAS